MTTPLTKSDSLRIGMVDFVSPDEIKVLLDIEAPNNVALNTGYPRPFPRINGYTLIPNESGFLVSQIEWITVERSQYPKRQGIQDFGIIDLPYPLRKMSLIPLGILTETLDKSGICNYTFSRGIECYPTVGDPVLLPTQIQLKSIVESGKNRRINIGTSPLAGNAQVSIDPDRLFGRHFAILGNTGSGKSCSTVGIIRWSIESAKKQCNHTSNARFIILDPNGEYASAFRDMDNVRIYGVEKDETRNIKQLRIPLWLWNSNEWASFTNASVKTQRPTLVQSLRSLKSGFINNEEITKRISMRQFLFTIISTTEFEKKRGTPWGSFPQPKNFNEKLAKWNNEFETNDEYNEEENQALTLLRNKITELNNARSIQYSHDDFTKTEIEDLILLMKNAYHAFGGSDNDFLPIDADSPIAFSANDLIKSIEANAQIMGTSEYIEPMLIRIKTLLSDSKLKKVISYNGDMSLKNWIEDYICSSDSNKNCITIIDLSLIPAELIFIITSVIARLTLESLQRYRKVNNGKTLPITLVMEEAHTFIKKYTSTENESAQELCTKVFEKIAREGRKFGLGLVLSSQRPSELSPTVLSQCNSFLLHRISNDRDQELVSKLVPDNLKGLLRELPSLPSRNAILLGWVSEIPLLVRMNYLKEEYRPSSDDPKYWDSWTDDRPSVDWKMVIDDWIKQE